MSVSLSREQISTLLTKQFLLTDSRRLINPKASVFFAIKGEKRDGHSFIKELYEKGVRDFVVQELPKGQWAEANFYRAENTVAVLQELVSKHRRQFDYPVIGVTGSNGKTIVKEWLYQLLSPNYSIIKSPGSYNSQIGVPLSVWGMEARHQLGIFEAGISTTNEMQNLQKIIRPTIGVLTNIGSAHDKGFANREEKIAEKLKLFSEVSVLMYPLHAEIPTALLDKFECEKIPWAFGQKTTMRFDVTGQTLKNTEISCVYNRRIIRFEVPFTDRASIENAASCVAVMVYLQLSGKAINERMKNLHGIHMRLELKKGINQCLLIDDTYNNDLAGLGVALDFLEQQKHTKEKTVVLSDLLESGEDETELYSRVSQLLEQHKIQRLVGVGEAISKQQAVFKVEQKAFFSTAEALLAKQKQDKLFEKEIVLLKGARKFRFEKIVNTLQEKLHGTRLEINLEALTHNLNFYKSLLNENTKLMVMVKAFAYGSSAFEIARLLQYHRVDYLAVAYTDEAVRLREAGITLPILVLNAQAETFEQLIAYELEPLVYSEEYLLHLLSFLNEKPQVPKALGVHLNIDTGMRRLGFEPHEIKKNLPLLKKNKDLIHVNAVMTHLAGADEYKHQSFSNEQLETFKTRTQELEKGLGRPLIKHVLNSAGLVRFPEQQLDMVRLGIGLYGIEPNQLAQGNLRVVSSLKTTISQIKQIKKGETIGYGRAGVANQDMQLATIAIGYADGFDRRLSQGNGKVWIKGKLAPVIGNVCMDMTMIDITGTEAKAGDEVEVFGENLPVQDVADWLGTIPYEVFTSVNERVKRLYFES